MDTVENTDATPIQPLRTGLSTTYSYRFANVEFDESTNTLRVAGVAVTAERLPLNLLAELLRRPNEVITRGELFETLWEGRPTVDHVLANAVNKLRRALGEEAAVRLVNIPRIGYRLAGPVERMVVGWQQTAPLELAAGQPVPGRDNFVLQRRLDAPARASVWLARDARLQQSRVFKFAVDADALSALKREYTVYRVLRQQLGERRDFVRVISANFASAPYFIECENGGADLPTWAAETGLLPSLDRNRRIALFLQMAGAVAAAHSVGVLHKDLKPANVLVDADATGWVVRLIDFGSSRLLEPGRLAEMGVTALGMTVTTRGGAAASGGGTPLYLAPELLAGRPPTTRSDLFALGLVLYQLLTGDFQRPMANGWERDIDDDLLRADLAAATEGDPARRLGSVSELIERLRNLPPRRTEAARLAEQARQADDTRAALRRVRERRPWVVAAVSALAFGLAASLWFYDQARLALNDARRQTARVETVNRFLNADVLGAADVTQLDAGKSPSMAEVLRLASQSASRRFASDPDMEASIRLQLGEIGKRNGTFDDAEQEFRRAIALLALRVPADSPDLLRARFGLADQLAGTTRLDEAAALLERTEHDAGDALLSQAGGPVAFAAARARFHYLQARQRFAESLPVGRRMLALADADADDLRTRFFARLRLSEAYLRENQPAPAEALLFEMLAPPYDAERVGDVMFARARVEWARVRNAAGKPDGVEAALTAARTVLLTHGGSKEPFLPIADVELANFYDARGDFTRAAAAGESAYAGFVARLGEQHPSTRITAVNLAINKINRGLTRDGLERLDKARPWFVDNLGGETGAVVQSIDFQRARALSLTGQPAQASRVLDRLDPKRLAEAEPAPDWAWRLQAEKARALLLMNQREAGVASLREALTEMVSLKSAERLQVEYRAVLASAKAGASR